MVDNVSVNPLTGLPGNIEITRQLDKVVSEPNQAVVYVDITDFKPYNEVYGFTAGDNAIVIVSEILKEACDACSEEYFLGHIGGDDFVIITAESMLRQFFDYIDEEFIIRRKSLYYQRDIARKFIIGWDRQGERARFSLMGLCVAGFSPHKLGFNTVEQVSEYASHLKEVARSRRNNDNVFVTPEELDFLPVPIKDFVLNNEVPFFKRRTVIEAMGESGLIHYGRILMSLLEENIHGMLKKSVIFALGRLRFKPAEEIILKFISDSNPHLRTRAVEALGQIGGGRYLSRIGEMLKDPNPYVAVMAVKSLGDIGHPDGLNYLRGIRAASSRWLRLEAAITRSSLGDNTVMDELRLLTKDPNPVYRKKVTVALENISSEECIEVLINQIGREKVERVKKALVVCLGRIAQNIPCCKLQKYSSKLWKVYGNIPAKMKPYLFPAVARCGIKGIKKILEKKARSESDLERFFAIEGMIYFNNPEHKYLIRKSLKDYSTQIRARGARAIGEIMDTEGMEFLRRSLKDDDARVRKIASESILKIASESFKR